MRKSEAAVAVIILLSFAVSIYLYPQMPEKVASHWNAQGQADGYMGRFWGLFLAPLIMVGLLLLFMAIPRIDPLKENIAEFRKSYDNFVILMALFMFYLHMLTILWNTGHRFNMTLSLAPAIGVLYYHVGILIENAKPNWFIGIRTPWTLSSETVWYKTHETGGKMFKASAAIAIFGMLFPRYVIFFMVVPVFIAAFYTMIYSYLEYQKEAKQSFSE